MEGRNVRITHVKELATKSDGLSFVSEAQTGENQLQQGVL